MDDPALEGLHPRPLGRVALRVAVIALAHPEEVRGEADRLAGVRPRALERPEILLARPAGRGDPVPVADVRAEVVLVDDLAHVGEDLRGRRDRRAGPGLEAIAEGVEVAVGADARIAMGDPRAAEAFLRLEDDEARAGALLGEVIGATDAGNSGADDQDVEVLGLLRGCLGQCRGVGHEFRSSFRVGCLPASLGFPWFPSLIEIKITKRRLRQRRHLRCASTTARKGRCAAGAKEEAE